MTVNPKRLVKMNTMELTSTGYWEIFRYELNSVNPGQSSGVIALPVAAIKGCLTEVKFQSDSRNADIALLLHPSSEKESIDCLYSKDSVNKYSVDTGLQVLWARFSHSDFNGDNTGASLQSELYFTLTNKDSISTGITVIEIVYQIHSN